MSDHIPDAGKMVSDTPRTDEQEHFIDGDRGIVDSGLARELERELNAANERIKRLEDIIDRAANRFFDDGSDGKVATEMLTILGEMVDEEPMNDTPPKCSEHPRNPFILSENQVRISP